MHCTLQLTTISTVFHIVFAADAVAMLFMIFPFAIHTESANAGNTSLQQSGNAKIIHRQKLHIQCVF